jgi:phosphoribosylglycinamide formyltransferase-1
VTGRRRTAVLISGRGTNLQALAAAAQSPAYPAEIALVVANRPEAEGLGFGKSKGIATAAIDHKIYAGREAFEATLQKLLEAHRIELICLAGFMRLLTPGFVERWAGRMINIHPALLPAFRGLDTHRRALAEGVKIHGCTVHFVAPQMDAGPIIMQSAVPVLETDSAHSLAERVLRQEHAIYPLALALLARGELEIVGQAVRVARPGEPDEPLIAPHPALPGGAGKGRKPA